MTPDYVCRATDPRSDLICQLTILPGEDGGVSAIEVELSNPDGGVPLALRVNRELSSFIMLTATDDQGRVLSKPARKYDTEARQQVDTLPIEPGSSLRWRLALATQLDASQIPAAGMRGRLVVNVALLFCKIIGDNQLVPADFELSVLSLFDMDTLFTRAALTESAAPK